MLTSITRTVIPIFVGWLAHLLLELGITITDDQQAALVSLLSSVIAVAYYIVVRWAEQHVPWASWLLGSPLQPTYRVLATTPETGSEPVAPWSDADLAAIGAEPVEGGRHEADE